METRTKAASIIYPTGTVRYVLTTTGFDISNIERVVSTQIRSLKDISKDTEIVVKVQSSVTVRKK